MWKLSEEGEGSEGMLQSPFVRESFSERVLKDRFEAKILGLIL